MIEQVKGTRNIHSEDAQVYLFILNTFLNTFNSLEIGLIMKI